MTSTARSSRVSSTNAALPIDSAGFNSNAPLEQLSAARHSARRVATGSEEITGRVQSAQDHRRGLSTKGSSNDGLGGAMRDATVPEIVVGNRGTNIADGGNRILVVKVGLNSPRLHD